MNGINPFDIVTLAVLIWAVVNGWRRGATLQCCTLIGFVAGILLAARYGRTVGTAAGLSEGWVAPGGFLLVLLGALVVVGIAGRLCRKLFRFAGLGVADILLGVALSLLKWLLLLSVLYTSFGALNRVTGLVRTETMQESRSFRPVCSITEYLLPAVRRNLDLPDWEEWFPTSGAETRSDTL